MTRVARWVSLGIIMSVAFALALACAWHCDDAFISFRYAQNLVDGLGLVFNEGERVEGFTNLVWTLWIAVGLSLGAGAEGWATAFGALCYAGSLALLCVVANRMARAAGRRFAFVPVAALAGLAIKEWNIWATGGLETSAFTFLALAGYVVLTSEGSPSVRRAFWAGAVFALAALTRPDGLIFASLGGSYVLWRSRPRHPAVAAYAVAFLALWLPTTVARVAYYGDFLPNTYYAKSAALAWYEQGFLYLSLFFRQYWSLLLALPAVVLSLVISRQPRSGTGGRGTSPYLPEAVLAAAFALVYSFWVTRTGGDFMYARMLIPVVPFLLVLVEIALAPLATRVVATRVVVAGTLILLLRVPGSPVTGTIWEGGVANEWMVYSRERVARFEEAIETFRPFVTGLPLRVAFIGSEARTVYRLRIPVAIESVSGLTDRFIARQPLTTRGRPGHEKQAPIDYLVRERKVHLVFFSATRAANFFDLDGILPAWPIAFGRRQGCILRWDPAIMAEFARRGAKFNDFVGTLDRYIVAMPTFSVADVREEFERFKIFYFDHVHDPEREGAFKSRLASAQR